MQKEENKFEQGGAGLQNLRVKYPVPKDFVDLSTIHRPVSDFLKETPIPTTPLEKKKYELSAEELAKFEELGYITNVPILTPKQVDQLLNEIQTFSDCQHPGHGLFYEFHSNETHDPNNVLMHALGAWRLSPGFHDLVFHPNISIRCSQLLENKAIRFWHDQLFCKPPRHGGNVAWHQDYSYWTRTKPLSHLTVHIALDDQILENGCLHYIPGSHKWELLPITDRHFKDMESIKQVLTEEQLKNFKPTPMFLKKGEAAIHHGLTVHGSYGNRSDFPRRATVINVFSDGVISDCNELLLDGVPPVPKGEKMQGQFFPIITPEL